MAKIALYLRDYSYADLLVYAQGIHTQMLAQAAVFTAPPVTMPDFLTNITAYSKALQQMQDPNKAARTERNSCRLKLESDIRQLANYVQNVSMGEQGLILSAGFDTGRRGPKRYDFIDTPVNVRAMAVGNGVVKLMWDKVKRAKNYTVEYCVDQMSDDGWTPAGLCSNRSIYIPNLQLMHRYFFRVRANGTETMISGWSDGAMVIVI